MSITLPFGTTAAGDCARLYLLHNANGMTAVVTDLGACLVAVRVPTADGRILDVALGHAGAKGYECNPMGFGATVGRNANRIGGARFSLEGADYTLTANENDNNLHSGPDLWFQRMWQVTEADGRHVVFALESPDGDQGFPGAVEVEVTYTLTDDNKLSVSYRAMPSRTTVINLTNHTYWNLDGHASGDVLDHTLSVASDAYTPVDGENIPTGALAPVAGTPFDLRSPRRLRDVLADLPRGYDHNFCLDGSGARAHAARLAAKSSGIVMDVLTDAPGLQVYMAGFLDPMSGKDGVPYDRFAGVALETQFWPDAVHHADWPQPVFGPEDPFVSTTVFAFSTEA